MILDSLSIFRDQRKRADYGRSILGGKWGDKTVEKDFKAECSLWIVPEKKVANICDSDWEEAGKGSRGEGLRSRRV